MVAISLDPTKPQEFWLAACVVVAAATAVGGIMLFSRKCQPKYYWLMDNEQPPTYWVGTATRKECAINNWTVIGGPYDKPGDAPPQHPSSTNRISSIVVPIRITVLASANLSQWTPVHSEVSDTEDFSYFTPVAGFYRLELSAP